MRGGIDPARKSGDHDQPGFAEIAREAFGNRHPGGGCVTRSDHGDRRFGEHCEPAAHGEERRSIVGRLQAARVFGFAERDEVDAEAARGEKLALGFVRGRDADRAHRPAAAGEIGDCIERRARPAIVVEQRAEGARPDILAADQAQPVEPLLIVQAYLTRHVRVHSADRKPGTWSRGKHSTSRTDIPASRNRWSGAQDAPTAVHTGCPAQFVSSATR